MRLLLAGRDAVLPREDEAAGVEGEKVRKGKDPSVPGRHEQQLRRVPEQNVEYLLEGVHENSAA